MATPDMTGIDIVTVRSGIAGTEVDNVDCHWRKLVGKEWASARSWRDYLGL